ncbi:pyridoxamine 5'-phosphate oxidase family protein [Pontibacillus yanchengensis]|uniref:pyridoxamine 5'-phosphate oxidase family protein n=1 Tax=Pontibacillus yanchengensis TaxID=462910 RepID=UPI0019255AE2|nr:pyridoxamine 5'-phosphate oxidase family protein [Pontibacillus yanchengensis]
MEIIRNSRGHYDLDEFLKKPLFAHLSTVENDVPKDSPVWFHWEDQCIWIIGTPSSDSFPGRIENHSACAVGIVDFDVKSGKVLHVGFRGHGTVEPFDAELAKRLLRKYLGINEGSWDERFKHLGDSNILIKVVPETVVVRDQSFEPSIDL